MKQKLDFVTNSSSASFTLSKENLTDLQMDMVRNCKQISQELELPYSDWPWNIVETDEYFLLDTTMDNFDMEDYLKRAGIDTDKEIVEGWHS